MKKAKLITSLLILPLLTPLAYAEDSKCPSIGWERALQYQQQSAEIEALQLQTYKLAHRSLDNILKNTSDPSQLAITTDLDETVLDNSPLYVTTMKACEREEDFSIWEQKGDPGLIPGALDFLNYADSKGFKIFYVSNRYDKNREHTLATLKKLGLPQVSEDNVLLLKEQSDNNKDERRKLISEHYKIVMKLGDDLHDLDGKFDEDKNNQQKRRQQVDAENDKFGSEWIVLPNAVYGPWKTAQLQGWQN